MDDIKSRTFAYLLVLVALLSSGCVGAAASPTAVVVLTATSVPTAMAPTSIPPARPSPTAVTATVAPTGTGVPTVAPATATVAPTAVVAPPTAAPTATVVATPTVVAVSSPTVVARVTAAAAGVPTPVAAGTAVAEFDERRAFEHVRELAGQIGSRPAGEEGYRRAATYVEAQLRSFGFVVEQQPFDGSTFDDAGSGLTLSPTGSVTFRGRAIRGQVSRSASGRLVEVGLARPSDLAGKDLTGKIAVAKRGEIYFRDKAANVAAAGAVGIAIYNHERGPFTGALGGEVSIPVLAISDEDGRALLAAMGASSDEARLVVNHTTRRFPTTNVVGSLTRGAGPTVVIGGHLDSVSEGPGANDNASGVATVLEVARVMAGRSWNGRLVVIGFGAEELGLQGSLHYVRSLSAQQREGIAAMVNLDMVGVGDRFHVGVVSGDPLGLGARAAELSQVLGVRAILGEARPDSDHAAFMGADIPVVFLIWQDDPNYHRSTDTFDQVRPRNLGVAGSVAVGLVERVMGLG